MVGKGTVADFDTGIEDTRWIEQALYLLEHPVELWAEHFANILDTHTAVAMLTTDGPAESIQDRLMNFVIALDHFFEILAIVHIQEGHDVSIAIPNMTEDGNGHPLCVKKIL